MMSITLPESWTPPEALDERTEEDVAAAPRLAVSLGRGWITWVVFVGCDAPLPDLLGVPAAAAVPAPATTGWGQLAVRAASTAAVEPRLE
jgi:hypothetical protein